MFKENQEKDLSQRERDIEKGREFITKGEPFVAREFFKKAGLSGKEVYSELRKAALENLQTDPHLAAECLRAVGYSEEEVNPLAELADFLEKKKEDRERKPEKKKELSPIDKLRLKELGLTSLAKNEKDFARLCFKGAKVTDKEIDALLGLNLLDIEKEKEKLRLELAKMEKEKK